MTAIKERIIGAVSLMSDQEAAIFWKLIQNRYIITISRKSNLMNLIWLCSEKLKMILTATNLSQQKKL